MAIKRGVDYLGNDFYTTTTAQNIYTITDLSHRAFLCSRVPHYPHPTRTETRTNPTGCNTLKPGEELKIMQFENEQSVIEYLEKKSQDESTPRTWPTN